MFPIRPKIISAEDPESEKSSDKWVSRGEELLIIVDGVERSNPCYLNSAQYAELYNETAETRKVSYEIQKLLPFYVLLWLYLGDCTKLNHFRKKPACVFFPFF